MDIRIFDDAKAAAEAAAEHVASVASAAVTARGRFTFAVSGGSTPGRMLAALGARALPWDAVHLYQVDERVAPAGDADRNLVMLVASLEGGAARGGAR